MITFEFGAGPNGWRQEGRARRRALARREPRRIFMRSG
jgi:hypothetical protein